MKKLLKDCFTVANGNDWDLGRLLWAQAVIVFLGLAIYTVVFEQRPFDAMGYGTGLGLVLAAGGAALGFKKETEPK